MVTFGSEQYVWHSAGAESHAEPDNPPVASRIMAGRGSRVKLPKCSVTVLRGKIQGLGPLGETHSSRRVRPLGRTLQKLASFRNVESRAFPGLPLFT
jgi:hypothetical protein